MEEDPLVEKEKWPVVILIWKILEVHVKFMA
jgi:hypothetical protein